MTYPTRALRSAEPVLRGRWFGRFVTSDLFRSVVPLRVCPCVLACVASACPCCCCCCFCCCCCCRHSAVQQTPPLKDIAAAIKVSGISKIDLSMEEVKLIVSTLVYDGLLEEVRGAASRFNRNVGGNGCTKYERKDGRNTRVRSVRWRIFKASVVCLGARAGPRAAPARAILVTHPFSR